MIMTSNYVQHYIVYGPSPKAQLVKNQPANVEDTRDVGSIPGSGRSPGEGNGNLLQYSSLENPMDRGVWRAAVHGVAQSDRTEGTEHSTLAGTKRTALGGGALFNLPYRGQ